MINLYDEADNYPVLDAILHHREKDAASRLKILLVVREKVPDDPVYGPQQFPLAQHAPASISPHVLKLKEKIWRLNDTAEVRINKERHDNVETVMYFSVCVSLNTYFFPLQNFPNITSPYVLKLKERIWRPNHS